MEGAPAPPPWRGTDVLTLPLPPSLRERLIVAGFRTTADLHGIGPVDLATEARLSHEDALLALKLALGAGGGAAPLPGARSAAALFDAEAAAPRVLTFCKELDAVLGGGVACGAVTEFCGVPGVGKTQLGMQLALDVQLPPAFAGPGGEALYVDTEGSLVVERLEQMAAAFSAHLRRAAAGPKGNDAQRAAAAAATPEALLAGVHVARARDAAEQLALVEALPALLDARPAVRLVVFDSVTFHFRSDFADMAARTRRLAAMAQALMAIAGGRRVAVVLMNQVTTKLDAAAGGGGGEFASGAAAAARLVPALGDSWAHAATARAILYFRGGERHAFLYKSPTHPAAAAAFRVTADGVRGARRGDKRPRDPAAA